MSDHDCLQHRRLYSSDLKSRPADHYRSIPNLNAAPVSSKTADAMGLRHRYLAEATTISTTHQQERVQEFSYERRESPPRASQRNTSEVWKQSNFSNLKGGK